MDESAGAGVTSTTQHEQHLDSSMPIPDTDGSRTEGETVPTAVDNGMGKTSSEPEIKKPVVAAAPVVAPENAPKSLQFKMTMVFLSVVGAVATMDSVIVAMCVANIVDDLDSTSTEAFWLGTAFLLGQTVTIPIYGTLSDIFGRKPLIQIALAIFLIASILCGTAQNSAWLIGARTAQGIGAGGLLNLCQVIISDMTTMRERGTYATITAVAWMTGIFAGVPIGGAVSQYSTWRWVFWINIPLCFIAIVGLWWSLHLPVDRTSLKSKLERIDWLGLTIFTAASVSFLIGITSGGTLYAWNSARVIASIVVGVVLYAAFVLIEWKVAVQPMMPLRIFKDRTAQTAYIGVFFQGACVWAFSYYIIVFFLGATQFGRFHAALASLPGFVFTSPSGIVAGMILKATLRFKHLIIIGWIFMAVGFGVNTTMHPDSNPGVLYGPRIIAAIGCGLLFPTPMFAVQIRQKPVDVGIATSVQVFFRSLGNAFGVAIGGVVFQNQWTTIVNRNIANGSVPQAYIVYSNESIAAYGKIAEFPESVQAAYRETYADSLIMIWWVMTALSLAGLFVSLFATDWSLRGGMAPSLKPKFLIKEGKPDVEKGVKTENGAASNGKADLPMPANGAVTNVNGHIEAGGFTKRAVEGHRDHEGSLGSATAVESGEEATDTR